MHLHMLTALTNSRTLAADERRGFERNVRLKAAAQGAPESLVADVGGFTQL